MRNAGVRFPWAAASSRPLAHFLVCERGIFLKEQNLIRYRDVYKRQELDGDTVDKRFMDEVVKMLALDGKLNSMPNNLSGGQQQLSLIHI